MNLLDQIALSFNTVVGDLVEALPNIIGALVLLLVGWIVSGIIGRLVTRVLQGVGADRLFAQHGASVYGQSGRSFTPSKVVGEVVKWLIRLVFLVAAANLLGLTQISDLLNRIILWLPNLLVAVVILLVAPLIGRFVRGAIEVAAGEAGFSNAGLLGRIAEIAIIVFAVIIAINQIGIAADLVNILFIGVVAALAIAFGLAFGLGGKDVAARITESAYQSSQDAKQKIASRAQQSSSSASTQPVPMPPPAEEPGMGGAISSARPR